jgi:hypothetical protein
VAQPQDLHLGITHSPLEELGVKKVLDLQVINEAELVFAVTELPPLQVPTETCSMTLLGASPCARLSHIPNHWSPL